MNQKKTSICQSLFLTLITVGVLFPNASPAQTLGSVESDGLYGSYLTFEIESDELPWPLGSLSGLFSGTVREQPQACAKLTSLMGWVGDDDMHQIADDAKDAFDDACDELAKKMTKVDIFSLMPFCIRITRYTGYYDGEVPTDPAKFKAWCDALPKFRMSGNGTDDGYEILVHVYDTEELKKHCRFEPAYKVSCLTDFYAAPSPTPAPFFGVPRDTQFPYNPL